MSFWESAYIVVDGAIDSVFKGLVVVACIKYIWW